MEGAGYIVDIEDYKKIIIAIIEGMDDDEMIISLFNIIQRLGRGY